MWIDVEKANQKPCVYNAMIRRLRDRRLLIFKIHVPDYIAAAFFLNEYATSHDIKDANIEFNY